MLEVKNTNTIGMKRSGHNEDQNQSCCSQRWMLAIMAAWLGLVSFMLNVSMNLALVCMVKSNEVGLIQDNALTNETAFNNSITNGTLDIEEAAIIANRTKLYSAMGDNTTSNYSRSVDSCGTQSITKALYSESAEFTWDKKTQSIVLSSYYYGYLIMQVPGGLLAAKFGGKIVIGTSILLSAALTMLMPVMARASVDFVIVARTFLGLCSGTCYPSICGLVGSWALPNERSRVLGMCWFGMNMGAVIGYSTTGLLCVHGFDNGWASVFYIQGALALCFVCSWWYVVYNTPQDHPRISETERRLILKHMPARKPDGGKKKDKVPWRDIFTCLPVYVVYITHMCDSWIFYLLLTRLPYFLKEVLKFDIESNGVFSCLPFLSYMMGVVVASVYADLTRSCAKVSITTIRKISQIGSSSGIAVFILIPAYLTCEYRYGVVACLCLCTFFEAIGITGGFLPNIIDISPRYSSIIFGISNTIATISGIVAPIAVGEITKNGSREEWRLVFFISAGISLFAAILYGIFANSELAPWDQDKEIPNETEVRVTNKPVRQEAMNNA